jgi:hypothetical protein
MVEETVLLLELTVFDVTENSLLDHNTSQEFIAHRKILAGCPSAGEWLNKM